MALQVMDARVSRAPGFRGVARRLALVWPRAERPGVCARGLILAGDCPAFHSPVPLPGRLIKCLLMRWLCSHFTDSFVSFYKNNLGESPAVWTLLTALPVCLSANSSPLALGSGRFFFDLPKRHRSKLKVCAPE